MVDSSVDLPSCFLRLTWSDSGRNMYWAISPTISVCFLGENSGAVMDLVKSIASCSVWHPLQAF